MNSPLKVPIVMDEAVASKKLAQMLVAFKVSISVVKMGERLVAGCERAPQAGRAE